MRVAVRAAAVAEAVIAAVVVWLVAVPVAGVRLVVAAGQGTQQEVGAGLVIAVSLAAGLAGWALLAVLEHWGRRPAGAWTAAALLVLLASLTGLATVAATVPAAVTLAALHLTVAGVLVPALARLVADLRPADRVRVLADLHRVPFYDRDLEAAGTPEPVSRLRHAVATADALVIVTPEYNGTVPGVLVNAVDWLSRPPGHSALAGRSVLVLSASPTPYGGVRAAAHLREVLGRIGAHVDATGFAVGQAHTRLRATGTDPDLPGELTPVLGGFLGVALNGEPAHPAGRTLNEGAA